MDNLVLFLSVVFSSHWYHFHVWFKILTLCIKLLCCTEFLGGDLNVQATQIALRGMVSLLHSDQGSGSWMEMARKNPEQHTRQWRTNWYTVIHLQRSCRRWSFAKCAVTQFRWFFQFSLRTSKGSLIASLIRFGETRRAQSAFQNRHCWQATNTNYLPLTST